MGANDDTPIEEAGPLAQLIEDFDWDLRARRKSQKTRRTYAEAAVWLAQRMLAKEPDLTWHDVTRRHIREHMGWLGENYSAAYASSQFRALVQFFKWASTEEGFPNPMEEQEGPTVPRSWSRCSPTRSTSCSAPARAARIRTPGTKRSSCCSRRRAPA